MVAVGEPDGLAVAQHRLAGLADGASAILCDWGIHSRAAIPPGSRGAGRDTLRVDDDGHVVPRIHADVHSEDLQEASFFFASVKASSSSSTLSRTTRSTHFATPASR